MRPRIERILRRAGGVAGRPEATVDAGRAAARGLRSAMASVGGGRRETAVAVGAYGLYHLVRGLRRGSLATGVANALRIVRLERRMGIFWEPALQRAFAERRLGMTGWSVFYVASQVVVLPATLAVMYRKRPQDYAFVRNMAFLSWAGGLVWHTALPTAPPRLAGIGMADAVSERFIDLDNGFVRAFYNPVAAMPSLHVGMSPVVAWALYARTRHPALRALGLAYPALVSVCVVVTGNHFLLDIAGGLAVVLPAVLIARRLSGSGGTTGGTPGAAVSRTTG